MSVVEPDLRESIEPGPVKPARPGPVGRSAGPWARTAAAAGLIWLFFTVLRWLILISARLISGHAPEPAGLLSFAGAFDAGHFQAVAEFGYTDPTDAAPVRQAFFPGYPMLLRGLSWLYTGAADERGMHLAGFTITTAASLIATVLIYRLAEEQFDRRAGALAALLLMAWPTATFLTLYYSEALYLALAAGAWYCATHRWWWAAGLLCAGASFTRINGVFLAIALLVMLLVAVYRREEAMSRSKVLAVGTGFLGAASYQLYLWRLTGDPMAWSHAQTKGWGREMATPWRALANTIRNYANPDTNNFQRIQFTVDIAAAAVGGWAAAYMVIRRYWPELTLTVLTFAVLMTSTAYLSVARGTLTLFPLFVLGGGLLARRPGRVSAVLLSVSAVWMGLMTAVVATDNWIG